jgi:acyl-CoA synthetase (AMP-forming)/AMP-acid ligase II
MDFCSPEGTAPDRCDEVPRKFIRSHDHATVGSLLQQAAIDFGTKEFLVADDGRISFAAVEEESRQFAEILVTEGVTKGTRVGLLAPNGVGWLIAWCALARIGAVGILINTFVRAGELQWMLRQSGASYLLTSPSFLKNDYLDELELAFPALSSQDGAHPLYLIEAPLLRSIRILGPNPRPWSRPPNERRATIARDVLALVEHQVEAADDLVVVFTSGSMGPPKAVLHTHGTAVRYSRAILDSYVTEREDVIFSSMPFFWVGGLGTVLLPSLHVGATVVTQASFEPGRALDLIEQESATIVLGWPQQGRTLALHPTRYARNLSTIRRTSMPDLVESRQRPPAIHADAFGMTETFGAHSNYDPYLVLDESKRGTSGPPVGDMMRKIIDPESGASLPIGGIGEVCIRGPFLMAGLLGRERAEVFDEDGWYHTGDLGRLDEDDWIYFAGRLGEMIKTSGGANVTPSEVEAGLLALPGILEAYVVGVPEHNGGQLVAAAVVPSPGSKLDANQIRTSLRKRLSAFMVPRTIWIGTKGALPFLESGKIDKQALVQILAPPSGDNEDGESS